MEKTGRFVWTFCWLAGVSLGFASGSANQRAHHSATLRIMPVGDSITRGTYIGGNTLANPKGGGWLVPGLSPCPSKVRFIFASNMALCQTVRC